MSTNIVTLLIQCTGWKKIQNGNYWKLIIIHHNNNDKRLITKIKLALMLSLTVSKRKIEALTYRVIVIIQFVAHILIMILELS